MKGNSFKKAQGLGGGIQDSAGAGERGMKSKALAGGSSHSPAAEELPGKWYRQEGTQGLQSCIANATFFPSAAPAYSKAPEAGTIYLRLNSSPIISLMRFVPFLPFSPR